MPALDNRQHERFCREYVKDFNASQATIKAGFSKNGAGVQGHRLLKITKIQTRLDELTEIKADIALLSVKDLLQELDFIIQSRVKHYIDLDTGELKGDLADLPDDVQAAIQGFERRWNANAGHKGEGGWEYKIKIYDKLKAVERYARHLGMFDDKIKVIHNILDTVPQVEVDKRMVEVAEELEEMLRGELALVRDPKTGVYQVPEGGAAKPQGG